MADRVREVMESMVPEFEDMQRRRLCTAGEVRQLAQTRKRFEYLVHRPQATREDFLRYLQLELNFESLLKCRRKRMGITKQGGADFAIRRRVHFIFSRALNRFKGDEMLWLQWIDFAQRRKSDKRLERIFGRALAVLPRSAELWTRAAAWELEVRANSTAARRLLQRALHVNRRERGLWLAYFRFELIFGEKTRRRREMLGVGVGGSGAQEGERQGESGREASAGGGEGGLESGSAGEEEASSEEEEGGDVDAEGDAEGGEEGDEEGGEEGDAEGGEEVSEEVAKAGAGARAAGGATGPVCTGDPTSGMQSSPGMPPWCAIAHVVFNEATAALGPDAPFHLGCLRTCAEFESAAPLARLVEASTRRGFAADPEVAASLASFPLDGCPVGGWTAAHTAAVRDGLRSLESSVAASPTEPVWDACGVWTEQMMRREEVPPGLAARLRKQAIRLSKDAHKARVASAAVYLRWALLTLIHSPAVLRSLPPLAQVACSPQAWRELLSACSAAAESAAAAQAALRICETGVKLHPHDAPLACLCLQLTMAQSGGCTRLRDLAAVREAFWTAARSVADSPGAIPVWRLWVESALGAADAGSNPETALEVWKLAAANLKHQSAQLKAMVAQWICSTFDLARARELRVLVLQPPPTPLEAYEVMLSQEAEAKAGRESGRGHGRRVPNELCLLYEQALADHGQHAVDLWLQYAQCHLRCAAFETAGAVCQRALKMLAPDLHAGFTARYQLALQAG